MKNTIVNDFVNLKLLRDQRDQTQKQIDYLSKENARLNERIARASCIAEITDDGIALDVKVSTLKRKGGYVTTLPTNGSYAYRAVDMYEHASRAKVWLVRIVDFPNGCNTGKQMDEVLGLGLNWSRSYAFEAAMAWLTLGKIVRD